MADFDRLYRLALENANPVSDFKRRYVTETISKELSKPGRKNILISGLRGVGKTTAMLQLFKEHKNSFYFSADSVLIRSETIFDIVESLYRSGRKVIFIDEIHKYPNWASELKNIYDSFEISVVASGSSSAAIRKGALSLGRRAISISASPLTLGEQFYLNTGEKLVSTLEEALDRKKSIEWLASHPSVERFYTEYSKSGGFPSQQSSPSGTYNIIKKMIYEDALSEFSLTANKVDVCERLLGFLSLSKPGEFSYTSFSSTSGYAKSSVYEAANLLKELGLIRIVEETTPKGKAKGSIKILFSHPNIRVAFAEQMMVPVEEGALREEFFLFHMDELGVQISLPKKMKKTPDYLLTINGKKILVEIGGSSKGKSQFMGEEGFVFDDYSLLCLGFVQKIYQK